jgi:hypothetical protein
MTEIDTTSGLLPEEKIAMFGDSVVSAASSLDDVAIAQKLIKYAGLLSDLYEMRNENEIPESVEMNEERDRLDKELEELGMNDAKVMGALARIGAAQLAYLR